MVCRQPNNCEVKAARNQEKQDKWLPVAEKELQYFQESWEDNGESVRIRLKVHASKREMFRAFSRNDISQALKCGWAIERQKHADQTIIVVMYYLHVSPRVYRPIHVVCVLNGPLDWEVITVYDPRSKAWIWESDFQTRICWCKDSDLGQ